MTAGKACNFLRLEGEPMSKKIIAIGTLRLEADIQLGLLGTPNQLEAVRAGMLKEPAQFTDPS